ncbi:MAG: DUF2304 domain-containing protein [Nanoarchaeota archaeon]
MLLGIQIVAVLFGLFMVYYTYTTYKRKDFNINEVLFWITIWCTFIFLTILPTSLEPIVKTMSLQRSFDLMIIGGFIFLLIATYHNHLISKKTKNKLERVVRELAIERRNQ